MQMIENMSDRELLMELVAEQRRLRVFRIIKVCFWLVVLAGVAVGIILYWPKIQEIIDQVRSILPQAETALNKTNNILDDLERDGTIESLKSIVDVLGKLFGAGKN